MPFKVMPRKMNGYDDDTLTVREVLGALLLRKWLIIAVFGGVVSSACFLSLYFFSPTYEATASLIINTSNLVKPVLDEPPMSDFERLISFHTQKDIIKSMPIIENVVDRLELDRKRVLGNVERLYMFFSDVKRWMGRLLGMPQWTRPRDARAASIDAVMKNFKVVSNPDSKVLKVTYRAKDHAEAEQTLALIIAKYEDYYHNLITTQASGTVSYLESQLREIQQHLEEAETALLRFKQSDVMAIDRRNETVKEVEPRTAGSRTAGNNLSLLGITDRTKVQDEVKITILAMESDLLKLTSSYTEMHPSVDLLKEKIGTYVKALNAIPKKELDLARLRRNFEINQELFVLFKKNVEKAKVVEANRSDKINMIMVLEAAGASEKAISPKPKIIIPVAVIFGLIFGIVCALIQNYFDHSIRSVREVEEYLGLRTIGSLKMM